jgi:hypothetical protein
MPNEQIKQKMPVGMIIILIIIGYGLVSVLFAFTRISPLFQLGPVLISGMGAIIADIIIVAILATIFIGILKRFMWARKLAVGYYILSMILVLIDLLSFMTNTTMYDSYYQKVLSPQMLALMTPAVIEGSLIAGLIFGWVIGLVIIIYLLKKKNFFVN